MNNYIATGKKITITAGTSILSGEVVIVSNLLGVAATNASIGDLVNIHLDGIFQLPKKTTDTINFGNVIYYDSATKEVTTSKTPYFIGYAVENKTSSDSDILVKLYQLPGEIIPNKNGWARYSDTAYTVGSPFILSQSASYSALPNNKGSVIETYLPPGVSTFYDGTKILPESEGDYYIITARFAAKNSSNTGYFDFGVDIGGAQGVIFKETVIFAKGANNEQRFSIDTPGFALGTFLANGGIIKIAPIVGNLEIYDISFQVVQIYKS